MSEFCLYNHAFEGSTQCSIFNINKTSQRIAHLEICKHFVEHRNLQKTCSQASFAKSTRCTYICTYTRMCVQSTTKSSHKTMLQNNQILRISCGPVVLCCPTHFTRRSVQFCLLSVVQCCLLSVVQCCLLSVVQC